MARKSNKTAHVLNLLAGHDAAKDADEQTSAVQQTSDDTTTQDTLDAPVGTAAQSNAERTVGQAVSAINDTASDNTAQPTAPVTPPAPAVPPQNNIAMIDKTEEDPVAELIQQKLSSEFEKQIQKTQTDSLELTDAEPLPEGLELTDAEPLPEGLELTDAEPFPESLELTDAESLPEGLELTDAEPLPEDLELTDAEPLPEDLKLTDTEPLPESLELTDAEPISEAVSSEFSTGNSDSVSAPGTPSTPILDANQDILPVSNSTEATPSVDVPIQDTASAPETTETPVQEAASVANPTKESASAPENTAASDPVPEPEPEEDFAALNVMEHIVKDKIIYYMRQFDVCTCGRCKADVTALTLNGLMPKYIVTMKAAVDPLLSYYTNRLISDVTVEATKACMIVKENPRH